MSAKHFANAVTILACLATAGGFTRPAAAAARRAAPPVEGDISGTVADSVSGTPLSGGEVRILQAGRTIAIATTDAFGRYVVHNLPSGAYAVEVRYLGYRSETRDVAIAAGQPTAVNFRLVPLPPGGAGQYGGQERHHQQDSENPRPGDQPFSLGPAGVGCYRVQFFWGRLRPAPPVEAERL